MNESSTTMSDKNTERPSYAPPVLTRIRIRTTRTQTGWQYAGENDCTGHNHELNTDGCEYPI
jgi:hypothetical protein